MMHTAPPLLMTALLVVAGPLVGPLAAQEDGNPVVLSDGDKELKALEKAATDPFGAKAESITASLDATYGKGFFSYLYDDGSGTIAMPRPYLVAYEYKANIDPETLCEEYGKIFGNLYRVFYEEFGNRLELDPIQRPVVVLVWDSKESYRKTREDRPELRLHNEEFVAGYYSPGTGILTQWRQPELWQVMFHEGTHQLVDYATRQYHTPQWKEAPWFQEGFADFMGGHTRRMEFSEAKQDFTYEFTLGQFIPHRYTSVQRALMSEDGYSLRDLVCLDFVSFKMAQNTQEGSVENQLKTQFLYAQGWALVMFLNNYRDATYKELFDQYLEAEIKGEGGCDAFAEIFLLESPEDWVDLEAEYREYVFGELRAMKYKQDKEERK